MQNLDMSKYSRTPLPHMRNLYAVVHSGHTSASMNEIVADPTVVKVHPNVLDLAKQLQLSRPRWTFLVAPIYLSAMQTKLHIYQDTDEYLGWVQYDSHFARYEYDCRLLNARRTRGAYNHTTKADTARSNIIKHFVPMTAGQKFVQVQTKALDHAHKIRTKTLTPFTNSHAELFSNIGSELLRNWDHITSVVNISEHYKEVARKLIADLEVYKQSFIDHDNMYSGKHSTVIVNGSTWGIKTGDQIHDIAYDQVSEPIRTAVGMLKLVEDGDHIPGYGIRVSQNQFVIFA